MPEEPWNPEHKPIGQLLIDVVDDDGVTLKIPALDKRWAKRKVFTNYLGLLVTGGKLKTEADMEEWIHEAVWFRQDMAFLLQCRHNEFWSYMVFEKSAQTAVVSFLLRANPFYIDISQQTNDQQVLDLYESILQSVLRVMCRLITNRESPTAWLTNEHLRELLYAKFLVSIPMLLDLIVAVGDTDKQNLSILTKIFQTLFSLEPKYKQDLLAALSFFKTAFRTIQTQSENEGFDGAGGGVVDDNLDTPYDDVVLYTLDAAYTLSILLEVCPDVHELCYELQLGQSIGQFYDNTIPFLYKNIFLINDTASSLNWLNVARVQFLRAFRSIANSYLMTVLMNPKKSMMPAESFVGLLTECLSERTFVIDYQREYPVELDMDILRQACKNLDNFKADFVTKGYQQEAESNAMHLAKSMAEENNAEAIHMKPRLSTSNTDPLPVSVEKPSKRNIEAEVASALDVLPHLGDGFLRRVLLRYEKSEDAIAAILEENLPPDLVSADKTEAYIPSDPQDTLYKQTGLQHFNVYDGDAYDIMTQDNPNCIIKQGKGFPNAPKNATELLDDKRELNAIRHRYQEYSLVVDDIHGNDEYEDEYDDSYEALLESETRTARSKQLKAGLADVDDVSEDESEGEDENENACPSDNNARGKQLNFCENPETVRARYEAKKNLGKRGSFTEPSAGKTADVVGAAKGQGQNKETLRSRNKKEVHKSSRANHNRKAGAAFKRSKGMMG